MNAAPRLFGTDGMRGTFGRPPLDEVTVRALGDALGETLRGRHGDGARVVLGGDTRASTPELCRWLTAGLAPHRTDLTYLGVVPTPAVAGECRRRRAACGIAVSASHNPHPDNGIKLLDGDGGKWPPAAEAALERRLAERLAEPAAGPPDGSLPPVDREAREAYLASLAGTLPGGRPLAGLHLALDAANGAASPFARQLFEGLGAAVTITCDAPDGRNINRGCGSTHPQAVAALVTAAGAGAGFAFDGDADRAIMADEAGTVHDGDAILYLWARDLARRGELRGGRIVATSMSNLGLERALAREGIGLVRCDVGDRVVVETLKREGLVLGGEQSGHIVHLGLTTTGDGLLTALHMAHLVAREGRPLSALLAGFERYPQLIENVRVRAKPDLDALPAVVEARRRVVETLGADGRLVLRYSGTEPLARIMIEGRDRGEIEALARRLAAAIEGEIGA
ncbi:MAG: phosphoglucosamine mutase [Acidobacteria bacterium]|nr:MAG: phosphoglucosamine mutase [Acidobacteriota bacterium]